MSAAQGKQEEKNGDKELKTSLFKWKPNHEAASIAYVKAANAFRVAKQHTDAARCFLKAAQCNETMNIPFHAAMHTESAADQCLKARDIDQGMELFKKAAMFYRLNGTPDKAAGTLSKAAKTLERANNIEAATDLVLEACEIFKDEEREEFGLENYRHALRLLIKQRRFTDAMGILERQIQMHAAMDHTEMIWKLYLSIVILHLSQNDYVAADTANQGFLAHKGFLRSKESRAANELLDAYEDGDDEALAEVTSRQVFSFLPQEIVRLARKLGKKGARSKARASARATATATAAVTTTTTTTTDAAMDDQNRAALFQMSEPATTTTATATTTAATTTTTATATATAEGESDDDVFLVGSAGAVPVAVVAVDDEEDSDSLL